MVSTALWAQAPEAAKILESFEAARPKPADMEIYQLDWEESLADAQKRALAEDRPIFFVWVTNITGPDEFFSGHC